LEDWCRDTREAREKIWADEDQPHLQFINSRGKKEQGEKQKKEKIRQTKETSKKKKRNQTN
jgi:hypothetical protein